MTWYEMSSVSLFTSAAIRPHAVPTTAALLGHDGNNTYSTSWLSHKAPVLRLRRALQNTRTRRATATHGRLSGRYKKDLSGCVRSIRLSNWHYKSIFEGMESIIITVTNSCLIGLIHVLTNDSVREANRSLQKKWLSNRQYVIWCLRIVCDGFLYIYLFIHKKT